MDVVQRALISLIVCFAWLGSASGGATEAVYSCLARQDAWLAESAEGPSWDAYLMTDVLREALAAPSVDKRVLAAVLARYKNPIPGVSAGPFVATRGALTRLADELRVPLTMRWAEQANASTMLTSGFTDSEVAAAKRRAIASQGNFTRYLDSAESAQRDGWKQFLKWEDLENQLGAEEPDWQVMDEVVRQFFDGYPGLEFPEFVNTRENLRKYVYLGKLADSDEDAAKSVNQYLHALSDALEKYDADPTTRNAAEVAAIADWLEGINRDLGIAHHWRSVHAAPNIFMYVSEELLSRRFSRPVQDTGPVNEMILGTHVRGTAFTTGQITTDLVPNSQAAQLDILFHGSSQTRSLGRQKPVTIRSTSVANLVARKPLYLYPRDVSAGPATASSSLNSTIHGITPDARLGRRLIERIAWKRALQQKPQADRIAAGRAARRLEKSLDEQTQELITSARSQLRSQFQGPVNSRGLIPEAIQTMSTNTHLVVKAKQAGRGQLSSANRPPAQRPANEVVLQLHESAFNNTAEKGIAGLTLTDERIASLVSELTGEVPEQLQIKPEDQPWSISFDWKQPVTVEFRDQMVTINVRGRRFTNGERVLNRVMEMSATYLMQTMPDQGVILTRQGDVEVTFPGMAEDARLRAQDRVFKTLMESKFTDLFRPVIEGEGFMLPGRFSELGRIHLKHLSTEDGWLSLGWN